MKLVSSMFLYVHDADELHLPSALFADELRSAEQRHPQFGMYSD